MNRDRGPPSVTPIPASASLTETFPLASFWAGILFLESLWQHVPSCCSWKGPAHVTVISERGREARMEEVTGSQDHTFGRSKGTVFLGDKPSTCT